MVVVMMACWALTGLVAAAGTGVAPVGDDFRIARATATDGRRGMSPPNRAVA